MELPDCVGLKLERAERLLKELGTPFETAELKPFFRGRPEEPAEGELRVVRQESGPDGSVKLFVNSLPYGKEDAR